MITAVPVGGQHVGITVVPDPENHRTAAGGTRAIRDSPVVIHSGAPPLAVKKRTVTVKKGNAFRLRYALLIHATALAADFDVHAAVSDCLGELDKRR